MMRRFAGVLTLACMAAFAAPSLEQTQRRTLRLLPFGEALCAQGIGLPAGHNLRADLNNRVGWNAGATGRFANRLSA